MLEKKESDFSIGDILKSIFILVIATGIGLLFWKMGFSEANIITIYILAVLLTSVLTSHQIYSLICSFVSVIVFNFFFTEPRYTLFAYDKDYPVTFIVMFLAAFISGSLAVRLKNQAKQSAMAAYRTKILLDTNQLLEQVSDKRRIMEVTAAQITKLLARHVVIYPVEEGELLSIRVFPAEGVEVPKQYTSKQEKEIAKWVLKNNKQAGATTDIYSYANCFYLSIQMNDFIYAIIGIAIDNHPLDAFEYSILLSILAECALTLENEKNAKEKEIARLLAEKEQLRSNLLRSISHDLRTPLTAISGNASNLLLNGDKFDAITKQQLYEDIYDDSMWLINLVENLLSITRIEEGQVRLRLSTELIDEVVMEALNHVNRRKGEHDIIIEAEDDILLARIDTRLIIQVIINLIDNAIKYTQFGSKIQIKMKKQSEKIVVEIADNGPGISDEMKPYIFEMFYSGAKNIADSRRSLGLGLCLCKSIVNAHGGEIWLSDNKPTGAIFTLTLPMGEVNLDEQNIDISSGR